MKTFVQENRALRDLVKKQKFMEGVLCAILRNKLRRDAALEGRVESKEEIEGRNIALKFAQTLATTASGEHAIHELSLQFPEIFKAFEEHV